MTVYIRRSPLGWPEIPAKFAPPRKNRRLRHDLTGMKRARIPRCWRKQHDDLLMSRPAARTSLGSVYLRRHFASPSVGDLPRTIGHRCRLHAPGRGRNVDIGPGEIA
jgi:hypothetical protein